MPPSERRAAEPLNLNTLGIRRGRAGPIAEQGWDMKHIGILAHSAEGATLCYRTMWMDGVARLGPHNHPEITLTGRAMHHGLPLWERGELRGLRETFMGDVRRLAAAGADFFVCPDNTAHIALEAEGQPFPIPAIHIADVVGDYAAGAGRTKIGILGTEWTMTGPIYPRAFRRRGVDWAIPDLVDRRAVHDIILEELCVGTFTDDSRARYVEVIRKLAAKGCDAVALACTEVPLLVTPGDSPLPTLDSTRLLAKTAVDVALGERPMPSWRGGPVEEPPPSIPPRTVHS